MMTWNAYAYLPSQFVAILMHQASHKVMNEQRRANFPVLNHIVKF